MGGDSLKQRHWSLWLLLLGGLGGLFLFQNCARPGEKEAAGYVYESLHERTDVDALAGETVNLTLPLTQLPIYDEDFEQSEAKISWIFVSPIGRQSALFHEEAQLVLENLTPQETGTYRGRIEYRNQAYEFSYRLTVREPVIPPAEVRGSYRHEYVNPICTPNLATSVVTLPDLSYAEAQQRCEEFSRQVTGRQNRAITCQFNGQVFRSVPSTSPRDVFVGQERPAANQAFQNLVTLNDLTECQARVQCHYFTQGQINRVPASLAGNLRCLWGDASITGYNPGTL